MAGQSESWCCPGGGRSLEIGNAKSAAPVACAAPAAERPVIDGPRIALAQLKPGQTARIRHADLEADDAALLRAMGLRPAAFVRMCRAGEPCIVEIYPGGVTSCACRIGLARPLADRVMCEPPVAHGSPAAV